MQAKVILIAAIATAIIVAVAVGYTSLFGASGNFKVILSAAANTDVSAWVLVEALSLQALAEIFS